ncbi:thioester reductase domain-containing protein [Caedibacter taeniospiralis]|uniref:thioester reductase domain-containing protein n=1 Tax=Caedibacter taeniospiralis TaxID=28907 RepID=UPI000C275582|nr:thioester reductase domain-containing protein [Caedibacter taeniospiralis]
MHALNKNTIDALIDIHSYSPPELDVKKHYNSSYQHVLLTGANGYLGVHLIDELLKHTDALVYCAIRAESISEAQKKLDLNLHRYGFFEHTANPRLYIVLVDLAKPQLGLEGLKWQAMCETIDAIYHNGAYVHHLQTYERMAPTNVGSTTAIIELASQIKLKRIHFISTKYAAVNCVSTIAKEGMPTIAPIHPDISFGYTTTKWTAEWLLWKAQENGIPVDIYRLGQITGQSTSGKSNYEKNNLTHFILGCIDMGYAPDLQAQHEMIPVDQAAKSIISLSLLTYQKANGWNLVNNLQITHGDIFTIINELGYSIKKLPPIIWREKLQKIDQSNPLFPLISYYNNDETMPFITTENHKTMVALKKLGINITEDYHALFKRYLHYWQR